MRLILASASPRRAELLRYITEDFEVIPSGEEETVAEGLPCQQLVAELARIKACSVLARYPDAVVIGSDTVVAIDGRVLGKPKDREDAFAMLQALSGRTHTVYTGVCLASKDRLEQFTSATHVTFFPLKKEEILHYLDTGEPFDKAGAYGIQGQGALFCSGIEGDFYTVMGLPVALTAKKLEVF